MAGVKRGRAASGLFDELVACSAFGLRRRIRVVKEEGDHFLEWLTADVDGTMDVVGGFGPVHFADGDLPGEGLGAITELDVQQVST